MLLQGLLDLLGGAGDAPPAKTPAPARLERPRQALLAGQPVPYSLQRARRRSIGFSVGPDGLAVRAPAWVTLAEVDAALQSKADWIVRKLAEQRLRRAQQEAARIAWGHGARLPYPAASRRAPAWCRHRTARMRCTCRWPRARRRPRCAPPCRPG